MSIVKGLNTIEKGVVKMFMDMVIKKAIPSLIENAEEIFKENKTIVLTIQKNSDGIATPMIIIYETDKIFDKSSPLMTTSNIKEIQKIDNVKEVSELISKLV